MTALATVGALSAHAETTGGTRLGDVADSEMPNAAGASPLALGGVTAAAGPNDASHDTSGTAFSAQVNFEASPSALRVFQAGSSVQTATISFTNMPVSLKGTDSEPPDHVPSATSLKSLQRTPAPSQELRKRRQKGERKEFHQKLYKTPKETALALETISGYKAGLRLDRLALLGFVAGIFIAFGGLIAISITGGMAEEDVGLRKLLFGATFPIALVLIVLYGADLFTGNTMIMTIGLLTRAIGWRSWGTVLGVSFLTNFVGAVCGAAFFGYWTGLFEAERYRATVVDLAMSKITMAPEAAFLKAIGCNWLVCLGVWLSLAAESVEGKILGCFFPIMTFVSVGFEHSVANMFFVPLGLMYGAPSTFGEFLYRNLILVTLGNLVAGALFMAAASWWIYLEGRRTPSPKDG